MHQITRSQPGTWVRAGTAGGRPVLIDAGAAGDLRARVLEAFSSLPKRGLEVGGVLHGQAEADAIRIQGFEEAPCEHRYGPSYSLSPVDRAQLNDLLEETRSQEALPVVGFFRSFVSRAPLIETADEEFVRLHFPKGDFLFLMLQPLSVDQCSASIRIFRDGERIDEADSPSFDFDPAPMQAAELHIATPPEPGPAPTREPEPPIEPVRTAAPFEAPRLPPPYRYPEERRKPPGTRLWVLLAVSAICGVLGAVALDLWRVAREPRWVPLRLDAKAGERELLVTWDAGAAKGERAVLLIDDGGAHREINLAPEQLRAGSLQYVPAHTDVAFRLILYSKGLGVSGDAVRIASVVERIQPPAPSVRPPAKALTPPAEVSAAEPATAVHEVQPVVSEGIRSRIQSQIVIPVNVRVDEHGRVASAAAERSRQDGVQRYLAELAEKAARGWRFKPAKSQEGVAITSAKTLTFVFTP